MTPFVLPSRESLLTQRLSRCVRVAALTALLTLSACVSTLDHQAELLLHPSPWVQDSAVVGALPGAIVGAPVWGLVALVSGPDSDAAAYALHVFVYPGELLLATIPWWIEGPSQNAVRADEPTPNGAASDPPVASRSRTGPTAGNAIGSREPSGRIAN